MFGNYLEYGSFLLVFLSSMSGKVKDVTLTGSIRGDSITGCLIQNLIQYLQCCTINLFCVTIHNQSGHTTNDEHLDA